MMSKWSFRKGTLENFFFLIEKLHLVMFTWSNLEVATGIWMVPLDENKCAEVKVLLEKMSHVKSLWTCRE